MSDVSVTEPVAGPTDRERELGNQLLLERVQRAKLEARVEHGLSAEDGELLNLYNGSPEEIQAFATKLSERAKAAAVEPPTAPEPVGQTPVPPSNAATLEEDEDAAYERKIRLQLRSNRMRKQIDPVDVAFMAGDQREMGQLFRKAWNQHLEDRKRGFSSAPVSAGDAPPVVR